MYFTMFIMYKNTSQKNVEKFSSKKTSQFQNFFFVGRIFSSFFFWVSGSNFFPRVLPLNGFSVVFHRPFSCPVLRQKTVTYCPNCQRILHTLTNFRQQKFCWERFITNSKHTHTPFSTHRISIAKCSFLGGCRKMPLNYYCRSIPPLSSSSSGLTASEREREKETAEPLRAWIHCLFDLLIEEAQKTEGKSQHTYFRPWCTISMSSPYLYIEFEYL